MSFDRIFNELEVSTTPFALCELQGKCDLGLGRQSFATLHYILSGSGEIVIPNKPPLAVSEGSLVLIPAQKPHTLRSFGEIGAPIPTCHPIELELESHLSGDRNGSDQKLVAICARVQVGLRRVSQLIDLIHEPIISSGEKCSSLSRAVEQLIGELSNPRLGSKAIIRALLLQCMIDLLRTKIEEADPALHWMNALKDERLWNALKLMLDTPGDQHSLESLAAAAGMSRSSFAQRFSDAYGSGPIELLRELRMRLAATMLEQTQLPVKRIAELVGFRSRSAFTRTFEMIIGASPRQHRKQTKQLMSDE